MHRLSAYAVWLAYEGAASFLNAVMFTVTAVYFVVEVGMNPLELVLVGTVMELTVFLFEVPTGVVADTYGRRLSIVIGTLVMGAAFVLVGLVSVTGLILLGYAVWGLGWTFTSGAFDAWLADELGPDGLQRAYHRGAQVGRVAALGGIAASVALASIDLQLPIVLGGLGGIGLGVFFALFMPETGFRPLPREDRSSWGAMGQTAREGVRLVKGRPLLLLILGIAAFWGLWSEGFDRLWEAHFLLDIGLPGLGGLDPVVWFGIFEAGALVLTIVVAARLTTRLEQAGREAMVRALFVLYLLMIASVVAFGLAGSFALALAAFWATGVARSLAQPIYMTWLNRNIDNSSVRATVISITNQADAVGQWTGGPGIGVIGTVFSIRAALVVGGLCLSPALLLYGRAIRHGGGEPELEVVSAKA
ncbi:MAG: MFS transporter [Actinobacteria bacterium]|nr:MFS transporter [Actinomycetota bacterium]